jgi:predicted Zn-dependent protease
LCGSCFTGDSITANKYQDLNKKGAYMSRSGDDIMRQISETLYFLSKSELDAFIHTAYSELETAQYKISMENVFQTIIYQQFQEYKKTVNKILTEFDQKDVEKVLKTFNLSRGEFKRYAQHMIEYGERKFKQIQERFESNRQNKLDKQKRDLEEILKICPKYGDMLLI